VEQFEDRLVPSNFTAATVSDLIADIHAANQGGGSNTITLTAPTTSPYSLTAVDNTTDGATGLPVIAVHDNLTIVANGDTIARSAIAGTPAFRLLDVAAGASLTLQNLTLEGGLASGAGVSAEGGAVYSQGTLDLNGVTVQNNTAQGSVGGDALGGGIYSGGALRLQGTAIQNNQAHGGVGRHGVGRGVSGGPGGNGLGAGLYVVGGTADLTSTSLSGNMAHGGNGGPGGGRGSSAGSPGPGGNGLGGGLHAAGGAVTLLNDSVIGNAASGGGPPLIAGVGEGGGLFIDPAAVVCLDSYTHAHVTNNTASTQDPNIHGPWKHC
jgi:hypothetical protein